MSLVFHCFLLLLISRASLPIEWGGGEVAAHLWAGRMYEMMPLMGYTSSVSNGLPAWGGGRGYMKEGNWVYPALSLRVIRKTRIGKLWLLLSLLILLGYSSGFFVWGREEEVRKWSPLNLLLPDSLSASFPFILFPFSSPGNVYGSHW